MTQDQGLSSLLGRVEEAETESVELFIAVAAALIPGAYTARWDADAERVEWRVLKFENFVGAKAWTDAALALCTRVLPGWVVMNLCEWEDDKLRAQGPWMAQLKERGVLSARPNPATCMHAPSPALALIAALLKALISQSGEDNRASRAEGVG